MWRAKGVSFAPLAAPVAPVPVRRHDPPGAQREIQEKTQRTIAHNLENSKPEVAYINY